MEKKKKFYKLTGIIALALMVVLLIMQCFPYWTISGEFLGQIEDKKALPEDYTGSGDYSISMWKYIAFPTDYDGVTMYFEDYYKNYYKQQFADQFHDSFTSKVKSHYNHSTDLAEARLVDFIQSSLQDFYHYNHLGRFYEDQFKDFLKANFKERADKDLKAAARAFTDEELAEIYNISFGQHSEEYFKMYSEEYFDLFFETDFDENQRAFTIDTIVAVPWVLLLCLVFGLVCLWKGLEYGVPCLSIVCGLVGVSKYISAYRTVGILTLNDFWWAHVAVFAVILILGICSLTDYLNTTYTLRIRRR